jgi:hypothetical protein
MISIFDYLGKAGGKELGGKVAAYGKLRGTKFAQREISNPKYTGKVHLYTKEFLDEYFKVQSIFSPSKDEGLPF